MSMRQIQGFVDISEDSRKNKDASMALLMRMAYHGEDQLFKQFIEAHIEE